MAKKGSGVMTIEVGCYGDKVPSFSTNQRYQKVKVSLNGTVIVIAQSSCGDAIEVRAEGGRALIVRPRASNVIEVVEDEL